MSVEADPHAERDLIRFVEAIALGEIADQAFDDACRRRGLPLGAPVCLCSPLDYLGMPASAVIAGRAQ